MTTFLTLLDRNASEEEHEMVFQTVGSPLADRVDGPELDYGQLSEKKDQKVSSSLMPSNHSSRRILCSGAMENRFVVPSVSRMFGRTFLKGQMRPFHGNQKA